MSSHPRDRADDVRAFLVRLADEAPMPLVDPRRVVRRARRRVFATFVGGTLAVALVVLGSAAALDAIRVWNRSVPADDLPSPAPTEATVRVVGRFGEGDLRDLVLRAGEKPAGAGLRYAESGFASARTVGSSIYVPADELEAAGFVQSFYTLFTNKRWWDASAAPEDRLDLLSWAMLFEDAEAAHDGFQVFAEGPTVAVEVSRWRSQPVDGLGDEATTSTGLLDGLPTTAYVWRVDNAVLFIASQGALPLDVMRDLAGIMDARAS